MTRRDITVTIAVLGREVHLSLREMPPETSPGWSGSGRSS